MTRLDGSYCTGRWVMSLMGNYTGTPVRSPVPTMSYLWSQTPFPWVGVSFHDNSFNLSGYTVITGCHHSSCHESNTCKETVKNSLSICIRLSSINNIYQWVLFEILVWWHTLLFKQNSTTSYENKITRLGKHGSMATLLLFCNSWPTDCQSENTFKLMRTSVTN